MGFIFHFFDYVLLVTIVFKILIKFNLSVFSCVVYAFDVICRKALHNPRFQRFLSMFSSKSFRVIPLISSSLIHYELISICGVGLTCTILHVDIQFSQHYL